MNNEEHSEVNPSLSMGKATLDDDETIHWDTWVADKKRKFLKEISPFMFSEKGQCLLEGTKPHGAKSLGYGKGHGIEGTRVRWNIDYVREKLRHDLRTFLLNDYTQSVFFNLLSEIGFSLPKSDSSDLSQSIQSFIETNRESLGNPDSPRAKKAHILLNDLELLIKNEGLSND